MINLAVTADFAAHRRGDIIRDPAEIAKVLASESAACVVKIEQRDPAPAPKPTPLPAAPAQAAAPKPTPEPQKSTPKDAAPAPTSKSE